MTFHNFHDNLSIMYSSPTLNCTFITKFFNCINDFRSDVIVGTAIIMPPFTESISPIWFIITILTSSMSSWYFPINLRIEIAKILYTIFTRDYIFIFQNIIYYAVTIIRERGKGNRGVLRQPTVRARRPCAVGAISLTLSCPVLLPTDAALKGSTTHNLIYI